MFKNTIIIFILFQYLFSQFSDVQISYEYNDRTIRDDKVYILEEFNLLIKNYFTTTSFSDEESSQFRTGVSSPSSVEENTIVNTISIYPNPVNDIATLSFTTTEKSKTAITIFNILGEVVYSNEIGSLSSGQHIMPISTSGISEGMYFVNLITNNKIITKKITIVK